MEDNRRWAVGPGYVVVYYMNDDNARKVLDKLIDIAKEQGTLSVWDYQDLIGIPRYSNDNQKGWTYEDVLSTRIATKKDRYFVDLPEVRDLKEIGGK